MLITVVPAVVAVIGLLMYSLADGKLADIGRIAFFVGLLVVVWMLAGRTVHVG